MRLNTKLSKLKVVKIYKRQREGLRLRYWLGLSLLCMLFKCWEVALFVFKRSIQIQESRIN